MARRHDALIPLSHDHRDALALAFRLQHPAPPAPVTPTTPAGTPESRALARDVVTALQAEIHTRRSLAKDT